MKQQFSSHDFVAFQLVAGSPPPIKTRWQQSSEHIAQRLAWIANCDAFNAEYFAPRFPNGRWVDFVREYATWIEFHKTVRQEKENE